jgi:hypothetical protein
VSGKFEFTGAENAASTTANSTHAPSIVKMCAWLEISRLGFYEWRSRPESATAGRREALKSLLIKPLAGRGWLARLPSVLAGAAGFRIG